MNLCTKTANVFAFVRVTILNLQLKSDIRNNQDTLEGNQTQLSHTLSFMTRNWTVPERKTRA